MSIHTALQVTLVAAVEVAGQDHCTKLHKFLKLLRKADHRVITFYVCFGLVQGSLAWLPVIKGKR